MTDLDKILVQHIPTIKEVDLLEAMLRNLGDVDSVTLAKFGIRKAGFGYQVVMDGFTRGFGNLQSLLDDVKRYRWQHDEAQEDREYTRTVMANWGKAQGPFFLKGNLKQLYQQMTFLNRQDFQISEIDAHPSLKTRDEYEKAVVVVWENEIDGWWNYEPEDFPTNYQIKGRSGHKKYVMRTWENPQPKSSGTRDKYEAIKV